MAKLIIVPITKKQHEVIDPILRSMEGGQALMAQVYGDGMRLKVLTIEQTLAIGKILGGGRASSTAEEANR